MRRSFGGNRGGAGSGGGGGSNGNMLRTLARTVSRASTIKQETTFSSSSSTSSINNNNNNKNIKSPTSPTAVTKSRNNCITPLSLSLSSSPPGSVVNSPFITSPTGQYNYRSCSWRKNSYDSDVCDDVDWVCVDEYNYFDDDDFVLGSVPSRHEAQSAVNALQQVIETAPFSQLVKDKYRTNTDTDMLSRAVSPTSFNQRSATSVSDSDWSEPTLLMFNPRAILQPYGSGTVYDAFHLLQTDPSVQRMVISLSSDPAVWNAVLNNEAVQELRQTLSSDNDSNITRVEDSDDSNAAAESILKWLLNNTKAKVNEIIEMINKLVNDLFQPFEGDPVDKKTSSSSTDSFEEKLRYSLMLTVVVLLIVTVARGKTA